MMGQHQDRYEIELGLFDKEQCNFLTFILVIDSFFKTKNCQFPTHIISSDRAVLFFTSFSSGNVINFSQIRLLQSASSQDQVFVKIK